MVATAQCAVFDLSSHLKMVVQQGKGWCFTVNNYSEEDELALRALADSCVYLVYGREVGDEGTPHLQGYIRFATNKRFNAVRALMPQCHLAVARGTWEQNREYCTKDGDFEEFGDEPMSQAEKGRRGAEYWAEQRRLIVAGEIDSVDDKLFVQSYTTIRAIMKDYRNVPSDLPPPQDGPDNLWYYGPPGTGKSRKVRDDHGDQFFDKLLNKWWDGYAGQDVVLLDDLDKHHVCLGSHIKRWADIYAFNAEIKNGGMSIRPKCIIVTSNYHPDLIWHEDDVLCAAIKRRFKIVRFRALGEAPEVV